MTVKQNLAEIEERIRLACARSGRKREEVTLIAVSKGNPPEKIREAYACGVRIFGENRVQELLAKIAVLPEDIEWHLLGHLQRNKVKYIVGKVALIHSVDSRRLAEEISKEAVKLGIIQDILLEINVAGEESKYGVSLKEAEELVSEVAGLPGLRLKGLMTIAPYVEDAEENRPYFAGLKQLFVDMKEKNVDNISWECLSMGMTGDYPVAISEGASLVRIGTGIFHT